MAPAVSRQAQSLPLTCRGQRRAYHLAPKACCKTQGDKGS